MIRPIERSLRDLRKRVALATYLAEWSRHVLLTLVVSGIAILLLRANGLSAGQAAWALALVAVTPLSAWLVARRKFLGESAAATWLDVRSGASGTLLTAIEVEDERWTDRAEAALRLAPAPPQARMQPIAMRASAGAVFAALALFLYVPEPQPTVPRNLFAGTLEDLREKLATLEEQVQLDEDTARELNEQLAQLMKEAEDGQSLEATFEAIGELGERLEEEAAEAREAAEQAAESLARAAERAQDDLDGAREDLESALEEMMSAGLSTDLPSELELKLGLEAFDGLELPEGLELDAAGLSELSDEMLEQLAQVLQELADAGLLDGLDLSALGEFGEAGELGDLADLDLSDFELCEDCANGEP